MWRLVEESKKDNKAVMKSLSLHEQTDCFGCREAPGKQRHEGSCATMEGQSFMQSKCVSESVHTAARCLFMKYPSDSPEIPSRS